ncbi:beta-lactamase superfamily domain-containing protein [Copromyces sp. CBS 386.78]|nr:beta-lactamase superfamily domain-containing protein [Copromyces sp. CBS 386.78]
MSGSSRHVSAGLRSDKLRSLFLSWTPSGLSVIRLKGAACRSRWSSTCSAVATNRARLFLSASSPPVHPSSLTKPFNTMARHSTAVSKPTLGVAPEDATDHHVRDANGELVGFQNPHPSAGVLRNVLQTVGKMFLSKLQGKMPAPDLSNVRVPVIKPRFLEENTEAQTSNDTKALRATWLGHACYYVEYPNGLRVLFDPVFEDRCAPSRFIGPKRYTQPPCTLADIPKLDAIVISHSHYDHLSEPTVRELVKHNPEAHFFVGLGLASWFRDTGIDKVTEMDWWEDATLTVKKPVITSDGNETTEEIEAQVSCLPCQHSSARTGWDKDTTLWCSFAVKSGGKSVWFGGDTGYRAVPEMPAEEDDYGPKYDSLPRCPHFKHIGELRGPFDLGLIPIGAYRPRWMWSGLHSNPYDAVEIFKDTKCEKAMGIHWGTWVLTIEEVEEPPRLLKEAMKTSGMPETGVFDTCAIGETREF